MTIDEMYYSDHGEVLPIPRTSRGGGRPWFFGDAPVPHDEPEDDAGRATMSFQLAHLPFVQAVHLLHDFIGDGRRVTQQKTLYVAERKELADLEQAAPDERSWGLHTTSQAMNLAWSVMTEHGWLEFEDRSVRRTSKPLFPADAGALSEPDLGLARSLLADTLTATGRVSKHLWGDRDREDPLLEALLIASSPEGLMLPDHPHDGMVLHCGEMVRFLSALIRHPHIWDVPIDPRTEHVDNAQLAALAELSWDLQHLVDRGLIHRERPDHEDQHREGRLDPDPPAVYRAPLIMRGVVRELRSRV